MNTVTEKLELLLAALKEKASESILYKELKEVLKQNINWSNLRQDQFDLLRKADQLAQDIKMMYNVIPNYLHDVHRVVIILQMNVNPSCVAAL